jgi:tyrosyl-tRNA synthetase
MPVKLTELLVRTQLAVSRAEARRLIRAGAIRVNATRVVDPEAEFVEEESLVVLKGKEKP